MPFKLNSPSEAPAVQITIAGCVAYCDGSCLESALHDNKAVGVETKDEVVMAMLLVERLRGQFDVERAFAPKEAD